MSSGRLHLTAPLIAAASAGPLFVAAASAADLYLRVPQPVTVGAGEVAQFIAILLPAFLVGGIVGLVPIMLGTLVMTALAERFELARQREIWWLTGGAIGGALAFAFASPEVPQAAFALVATSAICAGICRLGAEVDP